MINLLRTGLLPLAFTSFFFCTALAQDPDLDADEQDALETIYRTSDHEDAVPTNYRQRGQRQGLRRVSAPKDALRIGCICMDSTYTAARSIGACSGHAGVRYWLYKTEEGDTVKVLTGRHERHPQPLDAAERSLLARKRDQPLRPVNALSPGAALAPQVIVLPVASGAPAPGDGFGWDDLGVIGAAGGSLAVSLWLLLRWINRNEELIRYALHHLLRPGKRPAARRRRKNTRKPGV